MTRKLIEVLHSLKKMEFNVKETMSVLTYNKPIYWSWGVSNITNIDNKGLVMKVNGHHHKGYVFITLDWSDTYIVHIISTHGNILNTYEMVYFDMLVEVIDNRIEKIADYQF
jgi:hypothetical protein